MAFSYINDADLMKAEHSAHENARAKVRDVTPAEKGRLACSRSAEWMRYRKELENRGLKPHNS